MGLPIRVNKNETRLECYSETKEHRTFLENFQTTSESLKCFVPNDFAKIQLDNLKSKA